LGVKGFLAICGYETEKECLEKMLFGSLAKWTTEIAKVKKGDIGFLRNYEAQTLFGIFRAESDGLLNIDKDAWGGRFPAQVKVAWEKQCNPLQNADATLWSLGINPAKYVLTTAEPMTIVSLFQSPEQVFSVTRYGQKEQPRFKTEDGHLVRSKSETLIDNWFYNNGIMHTYESRVPIPEEMFCDFFLPSTDTYVEYWGLEDREGYRKRIDEKRSLYGKYHLHLVQLREQDVQKLSDIMGKHFGDLMKRRGDRKEVDAIALARQFVRGRLPHMKIMGFWDETISVDDEGYTMVKGIAGIEGFPLIHEFQVIIAQGGQILYDKSWVQQ
jgi:hypothetical protein